MVNTIETDYLLFSLVLTYNQLYMNYSQNKYNIKDWVCQKKILTVGITKPVILKSSKLKALKHEME